VGKRSLGSFAGSLVQRKDDRVQERIQALDAFDRGFGDLEGAHVATLQELGEPDGIVLTELLERTHGDSEHTFPDPRARQLGVNIPQDRRAAESREDFSRMSLL
jgi:hypothetical protein